MGVTSRMAHMRRAAVASGFVLAGTATYVCLSGASVAATDLERCGPLDRPICSTALWVSDHSLAPGASFHYDGGTFAPHGSVRLSLDDPAYVPTVIQTDSLGRAAGVTTIPEQVVPGSHSVAVTGVDSYGRQLVERATVTVRRVAAASRSTLADSALSLGGTALTLGLAAGAILMAIWRRPSSSGYADGGGAL